MAGVVVSPAPAYVKIVTTARIQRNKTVAYSLELFLCYSRLRRCYICHIPQKQDGGDEYGEKQGADLVLGPCICIFVLQSIGCVFPAHIRQWRTNGRQIHCQSTHDILSYSFVVNEDPKFEQYSEMASSRGNDISSQTCIN